jgi:hypothetical protein
MTSGICVARQNNPEPSARPLDCGSRISRGESASSAVLDPFDVFPVPELREFDGDPPAMTCSRVCAGLKKGPHRVFLRLGRFPTGREITVSGATTLLDSRIMAEVVEAQEGDFELDVARAIVRLHFSDAQNEQIRELADKNNRGELTDEERDKLESYRRVGNFLALLQSKARLSLKHAGLWQR